MRAAAVSGSAGSAGSAPKPPGARRASLAVLGGLVAGLGTSAFGLHLGDYVLGHARGDATRHIVDWLPLRWEDIAPRDWLDGPHGGPYGAVFAAMAAASLLGMAAASAPAMNQEQMYLSASRGEQRNQK